MPTVQEVLKATGMTDEQIAGLDPKLLSGVTTLVTTAQQALDKAELERRAVSETYDRDIAPALDNWANEAARLKAEVAFYKTQAEQAKAGGFIPTDAPGTPPVTPTRAPNGTYVANANAVPGSPDLKPLRDELAGAFSFAADTQWKYRSLFNSEMPDSPTTIIREAGEQRMSPAAYAAKKYDFAGKEKALADEKQKQHDDAIRAEAKTASDKEWAERVGSNPMVRQGAESKFASLQKAVSTKERPDPLTQNREQRHANTQRVIQKEIADNASTVH